MQNFGSFENFTNKSKFFTILVHQQCKQREKGWQLLTLVSQALNVAERSPFLWNTSPAVLIV